jgi:hypothetical protein
MTDRELMQQALEALTAYDGTNGVSQRKRALADLRERLAQPEKSIECMCGICKLEPKTAIGTLLSD